MINPRTGVSLKSKRVLLINAARMIIAIFTVLFATRTVLRSLSGILKSFITDRACLLLSDLIRLISLGLREKNATSEPDIKAEQKSRTAKIINPITAFMLTGFDATPFMRIIYELRNSGSN